MGERKANPTENPSLLIDREESCLDSSFVGGILFAASRMFVDLGELARFRSTRTRLRSVLGRVLAGTSRLARA